jgi:hypothetical protein
MSLTFGAFVDQFILSASIVLEAKRGFSETAHGPPPEFETLLEEFHLSPAVIHWRTKGQRSARQRVRVELPAVGAETYFDEYAATGERPDTLVVYHHGLGEIPHDIVPRAFRLLNGRIRSRCDMIVVKGLHHEDMVSVSTRLTADRDVFLRSLVASATLVNAIAKAKRDQYTHLVICGISMGGVISLLEAATEPGFDLYVPFMAGPNLRDVLFESFFARTIQAGWLRRARTSEWIARLDISGLLAGDGPPIRPLLAASDRLFRRPVQAAAYARIPRAQVHGCTGGHLSSAARVDRLVRHLVAMLDETVWSSAPAVAPRREALPVG